MNNHELDHIIYKELLEYRASRKRLNEMLDRMENDLEEYKKKENASKLYVRKTEGTIAMADQYVDQTEILIKALYQAVDANLVFRDSSAQNTVLQREVRLLKQILHHQYGFDLTLLPFYRDKDFRSYPFTSPVRTSNEHNNNQ